MTRNHKRATFWCPLIMIAVAVVWSGYFVTSVFADPYFEPDAAYLIEPLLYVLITVGAATVWQILRNAKLDRDAADDTGLMEPRRIALVLSMPIFGASIYVFGFVLPIAAYTATMCTVLGARRPLAIGGVTATVTTFVWIGFVEGLGVPLPLWPRWL